MVNNGVVPFEVERLGVVMEGDPDDPNEAWGVLSPACARGRDGNLYLFPRVVADQNYSRIGLARVLFNEFGDPKGVERMGYALEPTESYEQNASTAGCEDPRVTYVRELDTYLMTYTAFTPFGPRIALAVSSDLLSWRRLGLVKFGMSLGTEFDLFHNKDALIFPELIADPNGRPAIALIHRPDYNLIVPGGPDYTVLPRGVTEQRPSIWISYSPVERLSEGLDNLILFSNHQLVAIPEESWQSLKIGGGTPPVLTEHGWLTLFHGVSGQILDGVTVQTNVYYSAGALVLDQQDPRRVVYRSSEPVLAPSLPGETEGLVNNVVFPTALDVRDGGRIDVYYGMADSRIGVGRLQVPQVLPATEDLLLERTA